MVTKKRGLFLLALVVIQLAFLVNSVSAAGCYTYLGNDESLYCQPGVEREDALLDCNQFTGCDITRHFTEGSDCSEVPEICGQIKCDVDCNAHSKEWCKQLGLKDRFREGQEVINFNLQCTPGCCKIQGETFTSCNFGLTQYQCDLRAARAGVSLADRIFINTPGMNAAQCQQNICQVPITTVPVSGKVTETDGSLVSAIVSLIVEGTQTSATYNPRSGDYSFSGLTIGTHRISVSATGYTSQTITLSIQLGQTQVIQNVVLAPLTELASISGSAIDKSSSAGIKNAVVAWGPRPNDRTSTRTNGQFDINLEEGTYTISVSKEGYKSEQRRITVRKGETLVLPSFELGQLQFQGIQGITSVDLQGYGNFQPQAAVKIFVDGVFKGFSQTGGQFQIALEKGSHLVIAKFQLQKYYESLAQTITVQEGKVVDLNLPLTAPEGECDDPGEEKNIGLFTVNHVPGKKEVLLQWGRPCPEVKGYEIKKLEAGRVIQLITKPVSASFLKDSASLEWGREYTYEIVAIYDNNRRSPQAAAVSITLGDAKCEGKYNDLSKQWTTFCELSQKKRVFTCNNQNQVVTWTDCSEQDIPGQKDFYCARLSRDSADCKDAGICAGIIGQPFGVYHSRDLCYGTAEPENGEAVNFCYYDSSAKTITNQCHSCSNIQSCFNYRSKDACKINNCAAVSCEWVDAASHQNQELVDYSSLYPNLNIPAVFVTPETGNGYCVDKNYEGNQCGLCSKNAEIFENYFCTAEVCTSLGRCFSNHPSQGEPLSSCTSCGSQPDETNNCYAYTTQLECTNGNAVRNVNGLISESEDSCSWGRCRWDGGSCVKDGDATSDDDCESFRDRDKLRCKADNNPPQTKIIPEGFKVVSSGIRNITFQGMDNSSAMGTLHYCLVSSESTGSCQLSEASVAYPGRARDERVSVDLIASKVLSGKRISGETFLLRYASKDKFFNQENVKEAFIYVDNTAPEFSITEEITTVDDKTSLKINLNDLAEPARCVLLLKKVLPAGDIKRDVIPRDQINKEFQYNGLTGVGFNLNVSCEDDYGNLAYQEKDYTFDLEESIDIIHPPFKGVIAQTGIIFKVKTDVGATCELYGRDNKKITSFTTDETGKEHSTNEVRGFVEKEYAAEHKVVCRELLDQSQVFEDYFHFSIDFTPPNTQITLKEGKRSVQPVVYGWEEFFIRNVSIDFECKSEGFPCDKTYYCLGDGCEYIGSNRFKEYTKTLSLLESTPICYYSTDTAGSEVFQPNCGTVLIVGYGITLEKPIPHYYRDEVWGISATPTFTWQFSTVVPTTECRFDFKENFDFNNVALHKIKTPDANGKYVSDNFPESIFSSYPNGGGVKKVYVKCLNSDGEISPEQKMNLEYDPSAPEILDKFADPDPVFEGPVTELFVSTDDKTLCRYSDNSEGRGSGDYQFMEYRFPGNKERFLGEIHKDVFKLNFIGSKKTFNLNLQCLNGAGSPSKAESLSFSVDYTVKGNIEYLYPSGQTFSSRDVSLQVKTTKEAVCEYKLGDTYQNFETNDALSHSKDLTNLKEQEYLIPVRCVMSDHKVEGLIYFRIDFTAPEINKLDDGNLTCGSGELTIFAYSNETNITMFNYEVYDRGVIPSKLAANKIINRSIDGHQPIKISTSRLLENHTYSIKVKARDAAGNIGKFLESDGVKVVNQNHTACLSDRQAPIITFTTDKESSCRAIYLEMSCGDRSGCATFKYGLSSTSELCEANRDYSGRKIEFTKSGFICIYVKDVVGNNYTETKEITFKDEDGDGIIDDCDVCEETKSAKIVGQDGCSEGQVPPSKKSLDTDKDSLPDLWEQTYNSPVCPLDHLAIDSDGDGTSDNREDYDGDGRSNFEEFIGETDPCIADKETPKEPITQKQAPVLPKKSNLLAWILLIFGLVLTLGGIGYLTYYYQAVPSKTPYSEEPLVEKIGKTVESVTETPQQKELSRSKRKRFQVVKRRDRQSIFSLFSRKSSEIPHLGPLIKGETSPEKVKELAQKYVDHKEEINQGLKSSEKNIFARLESVVKEHKPTEGVNIGQKEAEDIFSKLKDIAKKRKK